MKDFKELKVWAKAHEVTLLVYDETRTFPREEMYGLTSQISAGSRISGGEYRGRLRAEVGWRV